MKAFVKIIWFALAIVIIQKIEMNIFNKNNVGVLSDKVSAFFPTGFRDKIDFTNFFSQNFVNQLLFVTILFLGLDVISGDIKGLIKGPIKLAFNTVLYVIGFSILFFLLKDFSVNLAL